MFTPKTILGGLCLTLATSLSAQAQSFNYADFSDWTGISPVGLTNQVGNILRLQDELVPAVGGDNRGAAWYENAVNVVGGFDTTFVYDTGNPSTTGGSDGFAFVVQNDQMASTAPMVNGFPDGIGNKAIGRHASAAGFGRFTTWSPGDSVDNSLVIHFDTYNNNSWGDNNNNNHISVHTLAAADNVQDEAASIGRALSLSADINDGNPHTVQVVYVPGTLEIYLDGILELSVAYDFTIGGTHVDSSSPVAGLNLIGGTSAFVGFTSGAGGAREIRDILSWSFDSTGDISGEPSCDGSAGQCPCFAFGQPDHGCPNSGDAAGALLVASGNAAVSSDTFGLSVSKCPADKPGLVLSGTADLSPGLNTIADSAGLLCVGGMTQRGAVVFTDASGNADLPDFQGAPYGMASNVSAGSPSYYQYWFRDPGTSCPPNDTAAGDFNFSNMWSVTWMP